MTVLVLVALPDPHSELQEPQELHEDTWQSITGEERQMNKGIVLDGGYHELHVHKAGAFLHQHV